MKRSVRGKEKWRLRMALTNLSFPLSTIPSLYLYNLGGFVISFVPCCLTGMLLYMRTEGWICTVSISALTVFLHNFDTPPPFSPIVSALNTSHHYSICLYMQSGPTELFSSTFSSEREANLYISFTLLCFILFILSFFLFASLTLPSFPIDLFFFSFFLFFLTLSPPLILIHTLSFLFLWVSYYLPWHFLFKLTNW